MRIAIVGAGGSGLVAARVLRDAGHAVAVFDRAPDVGGVWSATRRYPGIAVQEDRRSYRYSDLPMPATPEYPSGAEVRAYLERYATVHGLWPSIALSTEVLRVDRAAGGGWSLAVRDADGREVAHAADFVVLANGNFSAPHVPAWPGRERFEAAGGRIAEPTALGDGAVLEGRAVLVVGWGKTASDVATVAARVGASALVVARTLRWKHPRRIGRLLTFRHLLLTRGGEHLLAGSGASLFGRGMTRLDAPLRAAVDRRLAAAVDRQLDLERLGLRPDRPYADSNALVSEGFFEAVGEGRLEVAGGVDVQELGDEGGVPVVRLTDGRVVRADVVVPATGFEQRLEPLSAAVQAELTGGDGVLDLHRGVLPVHVEGLAFIGWLQSSHSLLTAELQARWLAARLATPRPVRGVPLRFALTHERAVRLGIRQLPTSTFALLDVLQREAGHPVPLARRLRQWVVPIDPADHACEAVALDRAAARR